MTIVEPVITAPATTPPTKPKRNAASAIGIKIERAVRLAGLVREDRDDPDPDDPVTDDEEGAGARRGRRGRARLEPEPPTPP